MDTKQKSPKYIKGYWRNKREEQPTKEDHTDRGMVYLLLGYCTLLLIKAAIAFPAAAMALLSAIGATYLTARWIRAEKTKQRVNDLDGTTYYI
jgi:Flp pilus assembly protein TadB